MEYSVVCKRITNGVTCWNGVTKRERDSNKTRQGRA